MKTAIAYSHLKIKAVSEDARVVTGVATTPTPDRVGDVVLPQGAKFKLPVPLLWQHDHLAPVGTVTQAKVTPDGIEVVAQLARPEPGMPSQLVARLDEAWASVKSGLVRAFSIGFRPIKWNIQDDGSFEFVEWELFELSLVTVPANAEATIETIKSLDTQARAAFGPESREGTQRLDDKAPGVPGKKAVSLKPKPEQKTMSILEQIKEAEAKLLALKTTMQSVMQKAIDSGETLDADGEKEYEDAKNDFAAVQKHLERLRELQAIDQAAAKSVPDSPQPSGVEAKATMPVQVKNTQKLEPGIAFARAAKCLALGYLERRDSIQIAKNLYGDRPEIVAATQRLVTKAAVAPATTTDATWAAPLVSEEGGVFADFVEYLRPQTILGRFGTAGIPNLRRVPFRVPLVGQTSGGDGYWVGEGQAKPLTKFDFSRQTLEPLKVANIAVATMEVIRDSNPSADGIIRDQLAAALRERLDLDFINPSKAAVAGVSPASITNGITPVASSGSDADAIRADVRALMAQFIAANNAPTSGVWIMSSTTALSLSLMVNALGQPEFPGLTMNGGTFLGLPVITTEYAAGDSSGGIVVLVNARDIYVGDEGGIDIDMSTEASLQMDDSPDNPTTASTVLVSLWQRNLVGFRAERAINWARRRASAVAWLNGVNWGAGA